MSAPRKFCRKCGWNLGAETLCPGCGFEHAPARPVDARRDAVLTALQTSPALRYDRMLGADALHLLFRLACDKDGRRAINNGNGKGTSLWAVYGREAGLVLEERGWVRVDRDKWLELTDAGHQLVRELVVLAQGQTNGRAVVARSYQNQNA